MHTGNFDIAQSNRTTQMITKKQITHLNVNDFTQPKINTDDMRRHKHVINILCLKS